MNERSETDLCIGLISHSIVITLVKFDVHGEVLCVGRFPGQGHDHGRDPGLDHGRDRVH